MSRRKGSGDIHGLLLVDKPEGMTSFDVVARLRGLFRTRRIGHTGTLDPMATGLMAVLLGQATKLSPFITATRKAYTATVRLGVTTDTFDADGQVTFEAPHDTVEGLTQDDILTALDHFKGRITQRPPAFSAIKVDGERLYERARRGEDVVVPERNVEVYTLDSIRWETPEVEFSIECSKGTYIRSVAHDLGQRLAVGGHLCALRRTAVGMFSIDDAWTLDALDELPQERRQGVLQSMRDAVVHLPALYLSAEQVIKVRHGQRFMVDFPPAPLIQAVSPDKKLVAIVEVTEQGELQVVRGIPPEASTT